MVANTRSRGRRALALLAGLAGAAVVAWLPMEASAHPLGNFTINRSSDIVVTGDRLALTYVVDMAEIPTFQARDELRDPDRYLGTTARRIAANAHVELNGAQVPLAVLDASLEYGPGQGGLKTLRLEVLLGSEPLASQGGSLAYRDENFVSRIGWSEVVVRVSDGAGLRATDAPTVSPTDGLRSYPADLLSSPLDVRTAAATIDVGPPAAWTPRLEVPEGAAPGHPTTLAERGFAGLIGHREVTAGFILVAVFAAMFWGAAHALSPGHGKAIVAAYLVGVRGRPRDALYLGAMTTLTHTAGVFALGAIALALSEFVVPETLYPWLNLVSALLVLSVGLAILRNRLRAWRAARVKAPASPERPRFRVADRRSTPAGPRSHLVVAEPGFRVGRAWRTVRTAVRAGHTHSHGDGHAHSHAPAAGSGWRGLAAVALSAGIVPCPTALVVLLAAISLQRIGLGLVLILAFSVGLAATIAVIGLLAIWGKRLTGRVGRLGDRLLLLPAMSAFAVIGLGVFMVVRALPELS